MTDHVDDDKKCPLQRRRDWAYARKNCIAKLKFLKIEIVFARDNYAVDTAEIP
jgi:hypothetical protein